MRLLYAILLTLIVAALAIPQCAVNVLTGKLACSPATHSCAQYGYQGCSSIPRERWDLYKHLGRAPAVPGYGLIADWQLTSSNLLLQSEAHGTAPWTTDSSSTTASCSQLAPDGTLTACKTVESSGNSGHDRYQITTSYTGPLVFSIYAKAAGRRFLKTTKSGGVGAYFDLQAGTVGTTDGGITATINSVGGGWYQCTISFTATSLVGWYLSNADNNTNYSGDGTSGVILWRPQLSQGTTPPPYVKTTDQQTVPNRAPQAPANSGLQRGATASAEASDPAVTGTGWSLTRTTPTYGLSTAAGVRVSTPFTVIVVVNAPNAGAQQELVSLWGGGGAGQASWHLCFASGNALLIGSFNGSSSLNVTTTPTYVSQWIVAAATVNGAADQIYVNGALVTSGTGRVPQASNYNLTVGAEAGTFVNATTGTVARVMIYNCVLSASEMQTTYRALRKWAAQSGITLP